MSVDTKPGYCDSDERPDPKEEYRKQWEAANPPRLYPRLSSQIQVIDPNPVSTDIIGTLEIDAGGRMAFFRADGIMISLTDAEVAMDLTQDQIKTEFRRQVFLCSGLGMEIMLRIVSEYFQGELTPEKQKPLDRRRGPW